MTCSPNDVPTIYMSKAELRNSSYYKYLNHPTFRQFLKLSDEDHLNLIIDLETWEAPKHFKEVFSYGFFGYDSQNRPIWLFKFGTYPVKNIVEQGEEEIMERYCWQVANWIAKSIVAKTKEENPSQQAVFIGDAERMSNFALHFSSQKFMFRMVRKYKESFIFGTGRAIAVNMNKVGVTLLNLFRPVISQALQNVEFYGKDENIWKQRLAQVFAPNDIPDFKSSDFKRGFYRIRISPGINVDQYK